jgi:uncharacterized protein
MLCFDIRSLEARAESVDGVLEVDDPVWEEGDLRPANAGVQVVGRLSGAGAGRFYFSGRLEGAAVTSCRRCLIDVEAPVSEEVHILFAQSNLDVADEDDVVPIPANERELDLRPAVREEWLVSVPAFALCREECLGLCPSCGADRNSGDCSCQPATDPRWEALRGLRGEP